MHDLLKLNSGFRTEIRHFAIVHYLFENWKKIKKIKSYSRGPAERFVF